MVFWYQYYFAYLIVVEYFHYYTWRILYKVCRVVEDLNLFENKRLVPGWTESLSQSFCDLTLIAELNSNVGIWNKRFGV